MREVTLGIEGLRLSRVGFGTSRILQLASAGGRRRLLAAACDSGFTHFDTAPLYGFGIAERELKHVLAAHPNATVATKVGLYPPFGSRRHAFSAIFQKAAGKFLPALSKPEVDWSIARARKSLDASLLRLGRECIDLLLLHEPDARLLALDEWSRWLETEQDRVRAFGVAGEPMKLSGFFRGDGILARITQCADSLAGREADVILQAGRKLQVTYGYVAAAIKEPGFDFAATFASALRRNSEGCILFSTNWEDRLGILAAAIEKYDRPSNAHRQ